MQGYRNLCIIPSSFLACATIFSLAAKVRAPLRLIILAATATPAYVALNTSPKPPSAKGLSDSKVREEGGISALLRTCFCSYLV